MKPKLRKITLRDMFGNFAGVQEGEVLGEIFRGYETPGGGWCAYPMHGAIPAGFWIIRWKGKRKLAYVDKRRVIRID